MRLGYALRAAGVPVVFVEANPAKIEAGRRDGVRVDDRPPLRAEFVHFDDWKPDPDALDPALHEVLRQRRGAREAAAWSRARPDPERLRSAARTRSATSARGSRRSCRSARRTGRTRGSRERGNCMLGEGTPPRRTPPMAGRMNPLTRSGSWRGVVCFRLVEVPDIDPIKHTKLMYNAAISPLAAAAGIDNGQAPLAPGRAAAVLRAPAREPPHPDRGRHRTRQGRAVPPAHGGVDPAAEVARGADGEVLRAVAARNVLLDGRRDPEGPHGDRQLQRPPDPARGADRHAVPAQPGGVRPGGDDDGGASGTATRGARGSCQQYDQASVRRAA